MTDHNQWKPRQREILQLMAEGLTNAEIGAALFLAHDTVRWYNRQIFDKLDVRNRTEAVKRAAELGLIHPKTESSAVKPPRSPYRSPVQYVEHESVHIAYQVVGEGSVDLLFIHGFISHLDVGWDNPEFAAFFDELGKTARVILFDKRGVGLSDRTQGAPTLENTVVDAMQVLDAVASKQTFVLGTSEGAAAAVLLASTYPDRVLGLILYGATPKITRIGKDPEWAVSDDVFNDMIDRMQRSWGEPWALEDFAPSRIKDEAFRIWWAKVLKSASSPSSIKETFNLLRLVDIRRLLPQIHIKTLVIHKTDDRMVSPAAGQYFADHMPNARWLELPGSDHIYFVHGDGILAATKRFITEMGDSSPTETWISTVLHAQLADEITTADSLRSEINAFRARYCLIGDHDLIATFESPSRAIQCATRLRHIIKNGRIGISLHVGESYVDDGRPTANTASILRKATQMASNGEILITQTLHDILAGSSLRFRQSPDQRDIILPDAMVLYSLT